MSSMDEKDYFLSPSDLTQFFIERNYSSFVSLRKNDDFVSTPIKNANFIGCFNSQNTSIGTGLIPFLEHDDANRALMGSNMQRQALPLKNKELSFIETGIERQIVKASELNIIASSSGVVGFSSNKKLIIFSVLDELNKGSLDFSYSLQKLKASNSIEFFSDELFKKAILRKNFYLFSNIRKSNQSNILNQKSFLKVGDWVKKGDFVVDGNCSLAGKVCCTLSFS